MNKSLFAPQHEHDIDAIAASWLAQCDEGLTEEEALEFERWCQSDPRHAAAAKRLEGAWQALQALRDYHPEALRHPDRDLLTRSRLRRLRFPRLAAGAAMLAAVLVFSFIFWWPRENPANQAPLSYSTGPGGYQRVELEDHSLLDLNANTRLQVAYSQEERRVRLLAGEATFSVAKNHRRPFLVEAGSVTVRAVGTAFNVRLAPSSVEILVTEGKVKIEHPTSPSTRSDPPTLAAGEKMVIPSSTRLETRPVVETVAPEQIHEKLIWRGPRLRFVETPLSQVVAEFNRHNKVQLELDGHELDQLQVDGSFIAENAEAFVRLMEMNGQIAVERLSQERIVLHKTR
jgi:transmembrane sensor